MYKHFVSGNGLHISLNPAYIDIIYTCVHVNYLDKILFKPKDAQ